MVARTDSAVLITGSTGTGKELLARTLHAQSGRSQRPLIKVNCAALPSGLVESEFFGHEQGAFTGAIKRKLGKFELADKGTIFLDEVGDTSLDVQAKLLRVLQEHELERVGGTETISVDVRVIAATNRDLAKMVEQRTFREDLYYRLNVFPLHLPPLRERKEDVPLLAHYFLAMFGKRLGRRIDRIDPESMRRLTEYGWPPILSVTAIVPRTEVISRDDDLPRPWSLEMIGTIRNERVE